jgi:hypothetical protein
MAMEGRLLQRIGESKYEKCYIKTSHKGTTTTMSHHNTHNLQWALAVATVPPAVAHTLSATLWTTS